MKKQTSALDRFLDQIIEKYTATPQGEDETIDYALRPTKRQLAENARKKQKKIESTAIYPYNSPV